MHLLSIQDWTLKTFVDFFNSTLHLKTLYSKGILEKSLSGKLLFNIFYEPSTRTRLSFAAAAHHLGMQVIETENAKQFSSVSKGESLADTIQVISGYNPNCIVIRHHQEGALSQISHLTEIPIINAGDGKGEHPTQTLTDLYTIFEKYQNLDLTYAIGGDLATGRTVRSLIIALANMAPECRILLYSPKSLSIPQDLRELLVSKDISFEERFEMASFDKSIDVVYWTRNQKERQDAVNTDYTNFYLSPEKISDLSASSIILHPLPRNEEIPLTIDSDPRAKYLEQAHNGLYVRMSLLRSLVS